MGYGHVIAWLFLGSRALSGDDGMNMSTSKNKRKVNQHKENEEMIKSNILDMMNPSSLFDRCLELQEINRFLVGLLQNTRFHFGIEKITSLLPNEMLFRFTALETDENGKMVGERLTLQCGFPIDQTRVPMAEEEQIRYLFYKTVDALLDRSKKIF